MPRTVLATWGRVRRLRCAWNERRVVRVFPARRPRQANGPASGVPSHTPGFFSPVFGPLCESLASRALSGKLWTGLQYRRARGAHKAAQFAQRTRPSGAPRFPHPLAGFRPARNFVLRPSFVMPGLDPGIHAVTPQQTEAPVEWIAGSSPAMTSRERRSVDQAASPLRCSG